MKNRYQSNALNRVKDYVLRSATGLALCVPSCITLNFNVEVPVYVDGEQIGEVGLDTLNDMGGLEGLTNILSDFLPKE
jgi:hypothetical protein